MATRAEATAGGVAGGEAPTNHLVQALCTDWYQLSMVYAYWKNGKSEEDATFDLFFRKNPFKGEFALFAGLDEVVRFLNTFCITEEDMVYLRTQLPQAEEAFFEYLGALDASKLRVSAVRHGEIVFPREPLLRIEGPLAVAQLLETPLLNLVNYPSLVATNAARMRNAAGMDKGLLEFGLRRAQGPDGGLSASKYSYVGGFDGTSNVLAGKLTGIPVRGTHAHAFVMSYSSLDDLSDLRELASHPGVDFVANVLRWRETLCAGDTTTNDGELAAFIAYALAYPDGFLGLVDTYDTLQSGVPNFLAVAAALQELGHKPVGIRLDSGDLAYLSRETRALFVKAGQETGYESFASMKIVASNDINEAALLQLNRDGHEIDQFGIGTHLVTCQAQPALGGVYKLVELEGMPRIKLSQEIQKMVIPGKKSVYRLYGEEGFALVDLVQRASEPAPVVGQRILCRHPIEEAKRVYVTPTRVEPLLHVIWDGASTEPADTLMSARSRVMDALQNFRPDHLRAVNPTSYKVSVSPETYEYMHQMWMDNAPVRDLR